MIGAREFENTRYLPEWEERTPQGLRYARGSASERSDGSLAVYDGAGNYVGDVSRHGELRFSGEAGPYKESFLLSAAEQLRKPEAG